MQLAARLRGCRVALRRICNARRPPEWIPCLDRRRASVVAPAARSHEQATPPSTDPAVDRARRRASPLPPQRMPIRPMHAVADSLQPATGCRHSPDGEPGPPAGGPHPRRYTPTVPETTGNAAPPASPQQPTPPTRSGRASRPPAATAAAPATPPPTIDDQIADQLHQLSSGKFDHILGGKSERTSIEAFYSGRSYAPIWTHRRPRQCPHQGRDRLPRPCRCRWPRSRRIIRYRISNR